MVRLLDPLVGEKVAMRVDVDLEGESAARQLDSLKWPHPTRHPKRPSLARRAGCLCIPLR